MCEISGLVYGGWKLRVYLGAPLSDQQMGLMGFRCRLCLEQVVVACSAEMWWVKYHALQDTSLEVAMFRSIHSRTTMRESTMVHHWLASEPKTSLPYFGIRDHPDLHKTFIVPHLWGYTRLRGPLPDMWPIWQNASLSFGEEVFLAGAAGTLRPFIVFYDDFHHAKFPNSQPVPKTIQTRRGLEYVGRLANHRETDILAGWKALHHVNRDARATTSALPPCLTRWTPTSSTWNYTFPNFGEDTVACLVLALAFGFVFFFPLFF